MKSMFLGIAGNIGPLLFMTIPFIVVPLLIARFLVRAEWLQIACAYPIWFLALFLFLGGGTTPGGLDEGIGWTMIMGMFFTWVGVPVVCLLLKLSNLPYRFL